MKRYVEFASTILDSRIFELGQQKIVMINCSPYCVSDDGNMVPVTNQDGYYDDVVNLLRSHYGLSIHDIDYLADNYDWMRQQVVIKREFLSLDERRQAIVELVIESATCAYLRVKTYDNYWDNYRKPIDNPVPLSRAAIDQVFIDFCDKFFGENNYKIKN